MVFVDDKIKHILQVFAERSKVSVGDIMSDDTTRKVCTVRYMIFTYLHINLRISGSRLSKIFGRTRESILRGIRILKGWMECYKDIQETYISIINEIEES